MQLKFFDIHSHINFSAFDEDRNDVIKRAHDAGVAMINVGTQKDTSSSAVELSEKYRDGVYATVGLHPIHAGGSTYHDKKELSAGEFSKQDTSMDVEFYKKIAEHNKVLSIGECGLDYFRCDEPTKNIQKVKFIEQVHIANEAGKPLMLHVRGERGDDTPYKHALEIMKSEARVVGNFHFFAGSLDMAKQIWDSGFSTSFTGVITFTNDYDDVVKAAPIEALMTETDCPYVSPPPHRGERNEPIHVRYVVKRISEIRKKSFDDTAHVLLENALRVFNISDSINL